LCERDPHLVLEGAAVVARADATPHLAVRVPAAWLDARAALERAAAEARAADLAGALSLDSGVDPVRAARLARAAQLGVDWYERHLTLLCAASGDVLRPGLYELPAGASVADALAAAGGAVDGLFSAPAARFGCDGEATTDAARAAPAALLVFVARRGPLA
jgi:NADH:ubiquinone oxidoreductase subunit F (NADH-binding)